MNLYKIVRESGQVNYDHVSVSANLTWGRGALGVCSNVSKGHCKTPGTLCYAHATELHWPVILRKTVNADIHCFDIHRDGSSDNFVFYYMKRYVINSCRSDGR